MKSIIDALQMNRYRLLYFITSRQRIEDKPGLKAGLVKLFEYKSDGHFYADWDFLFREGFLESKEGYIIATEKAIREFSFISWSKATTIASIGLGVTLLFYYSLILIGLSPNIQGLLLTSLILILLGVGFHRVYTQFTPSLPSREKLRNSNL